MDPNRRGDPVRKTFFAQEETPAPVVAGEVFRKFTMSRTSAQRATMRSIADRLATVLTPAPTESDIYLALADVAGADSTVFDALILRCPGITSTRLAENNRKTAERLDGRTA
jgi:hypothetical protein